MVKTAASNTEYLNPKGMPKLKAYRERRIRLLLENLKYLQGGNGKCPLCGCGLRHNSSLTGWWQCNALGAVGFQTGDGVGKPPCSFQFFYDPSESERAEIERRLAVPS